MNTYDLFLPLNLGPTGFTAGNATRVAQTLAYMARSVKSGTTTSGMDIQPVGGSDAAAPVKGIVYRINTDFRLPSQLEDTSTDGGGTIIGTASNTNGAKPRITLVSKDNTKAVQMPQWLQKYAMAGDMAVYVGTNPLLESTDALLEYLPIGSGGLGVWLGRVNADSISDINNNAFSTSLGYAFIGSPRRAAQVGSEIVALPTSKKVALSRRG